MLSAQNNFLLIMGSKFRLQWHEVSQQSGGEEESSGNEGDCTYYWFTV